MLLLHGGGGEAGAMCNTAEWCSNSAGRRGGVGCCPTVCAIRRAAQQMLLGAAQQTMLAISDNTQRQVGSGRLGEEGEDRQSHSPRAFGPWWRLSVPLVLTRKNAFWLVKKRREKKLRAPTFFRLQLRITAPMGVSISTSSVGLTYVAQFNMLVPHISR